MGKSQAFFVPLQPIRLCHARWVCNSVQRREAEVAENDQLKAPQGGGAAKLLELDVDEIDSPALARLIEEIRKDEPATTRAYHRTYHRHNR